MKLRILLSPVLLTAFLLGACDSAGTRVPENTVATAAGVDFPVEAAAELLAPQTQLPNQSVVVDALADLWINYFLVARVVAEDTTLANIDVTPLVRQTTDQELVLQLRDQVIQFDTVFTDEELREIYERDLPGARIRARHILLRFPENATDAQEDSVWALAESLKARIDTGESFPVLAGQFSQDRGTATSGGDLGTFSRGQMVPQFEEVAFNLAEGEVSDVVETTFGLHIIKLEEKIIPPFEENMDQFRVQMKNRRIAEAESTYVADLLDRVDLEILSDGFETVRRLADDPEIPLTRRAEQRPLMRFDGGEFTAADFRDWVILRPLGLRNEIRNAEDDRLEGMMRNIARERLLVREAEIEGMEVSQARKDSLATSIRQGLRSVARQLGFMDLPEEVQASGTDLDQVVYGAVLDLLQEVVEERRDVIPLGGITMVLRQQYDARVFEAGVRQTLARVAALRTQGPPPPPSQPRSDSTGMAPSDTSSPGGVQPGTETRNP